LGVFSAGDVELWVKEASPALRGAYVHRVWRTETTWVLLARHHEGGDPEARAVERIAFEVALDGQWARAVAVTPDWVSADDKKLKKAWGKDGHPFLTLLRKHLVGCRLRGAEQVSGDRIVRLTCERPARSPNNPEAEEGPLLRHLVVELIGRIGNLILTTQGETSEPQVIVRALNAGRSRRPLASGDAYQAPPPRPNAGEAPAELVTDVAPNHETLALGLAVAARQRAVEEEAAQSSRKGALLRAAKKAVKRGEGVLKKLEAQLAEVAKADEHERLGDLIKANLHELPAQAAAVTLTDYATGEQVELKLDPTKTVQQAMKASYKKAKKLRSGEIHVLTRQGETDAQLEELRVALADLEAAADDDEEGLDALEARLRKLKVLPKAKQKQKQKQQVNQGPRSYRTKEGHEVLVGRNDDENDRLTMRMARGNDLFFHVAGCPGSHVILRVDPKRPPNHESLVDAASLAVYYSKARNRGRVDVHYTPRKWVKKPKGAKPGLVTISNYKMVRAGGEGERIQRLFDTARRDGEDA
jgi:predicted ribosome quality control (RQC) complex YloA/Tae2 family protein